MLSDEEKRAALREVLQTPAFVRAGQLQAFLRLICEMEIAGRAGDINEYLIGVEVLGRPQGYSPAQDSAVRRRAVDLREKLDEVYAGELASAAVRIELPKGRYVPRFVRVETTAPPANPTVETPPPSRSTERRWPPLLAAFLAGVAVTSAVFLLGPWRRHTPQEGGTTYEAEARDNVVGGTVVGEPCEGCSGHYRVRRIGNAPGSSVMVKNVLAPRAGTYTVHVYYLLSGDRTFYVRVNDRPPVELPLSGSSWTKPASAALSLPLDAGLNSITFYNDSAYAPDLDRIVVSGPK